MPARVGPEESNNNDLQGSSADDDAVYAQQPLATASANVQQPPHDQGNHTSVATAQQQTSTSHHGGEHRGCKFPPIPGGREDLVLQLLTERRRAPNQVVNQPGFLTHAETMALVRLANMAYNTGVHPLSSEN
jgi:hypothetical protein